MEGLGDGLFRALREAGMAEVPDGFSVALVHQEIPSEVVTQVEAFIRVFESVTTRPEWQQRVTASAAEIARNRRPDPLSALVRRDFSPRRSAGNRR